MRVRFEPVDNPKNGTRIGVRVVPVDESGAIRTAKLFAETQTVEAVSRTNAALTVAAAEAVTALHAADRDERVIVPVSGRALAGTEAAERTLKALKAVDRDLRGHLIAEVFDMARSVSLEAVEDVTVPLLAYVGGFLAEPPDTLDDYTVFSNCNYIGVTVDLSGRDDAAAALTRTWAGASKCRLRLFVSGVDTADLKAQCARYESRGISGAAVAPPGDAP